MDKVGIGSRLQEVRRGKRITAEKLAEIVGVSVQTIGNIERGKKGTSMQTFIKICESLDASSDYILFGK